ncbi:MAG: hypothetical protein AB6733_18400 [Clostridiaceae bacterium]
MKKDLNYDYIKKEIIIVQDSKNAYFAKLMAKRGIKVISANKKINIFFSAIRKLHYKLKIPFYHIWYNSDVYRVYNDKIIIMFDATLSDYFIKWIKKKSPSNRYIFWYWNPVRNNRKPLSMKNSFCEMWSYSPVDCTKYKLIPNTTFYFKELHVNNSEVENDIFFIGKDKGRLPALLELEKKFKSMKLRTYFHITPDKLYHLKTNKIYKKTLSYDVLLGHIGKSKAILDYVEQTDDGLSLRPMESLFFKKKLITNNRLIVNYDFYNSNNIFVLGVDDIDNLTNFLDMPYEEISNEIIEKYDFEKWLYRFLE